MSIECHVKSGRSSAISNCKMPLEAGSDSLRKKGQSCKKLSACFCYVLTANFFTEVHEMDCLVFVSIDFIVALKQIKWGSKQALA